MSDTFSPFVTAPPDYNALTTPGIQLWPPRGVPLQSLPGVTIPGANRAVATPGAPPFSITSRPAPGTPFNTDWLRWLWQPAVPAAQAAPAAPSPGFHAGTGPGPYDQPAPAPAAPAAPTGPLLTPLATEMPLDQRAAAYRQATAAARQQLTADQLNQQSLAAANAGRTYFNPQQAAAYGQPMAPGAYGPPTNVTNALTMPPQTNLQGPAVPPPPSAALATGLPQSRRPAPGQSTPAQYAMLNMQGLY